MATKLHSVTGQIVHTLGNRRDRGQIMSLRANFNKNGARALVSLFRVTGTKHSLLGSTCATGLLRRNMIPGFSGTGITMFAGGAASIMRKHAAGRNVAVCAL